MSPGSFLAPAARRGAGPALIAHAAGNNLAAVRGAIAAGADLIEVDLWLHRGLFEARHERAVYPLPFLFERWYLRRAPRHPFGLGDLLAEAAAGPGVLLDLKNGPPRTAAILAEQLAAAPGAKVAASSQAWPVLRALRQELPALPLYYSIDVRARLDLFLSVADRDLEPAGVSCRHSLLDGSTVASLRDRGLQVIAWTVDEPGRAAELAAWGVDAITTHRIAELRAALAAPA